MKEETIVEVAKVLERWNPLGERANSIESLEGYRYEAIDIISCYQMMKSSDQVAEATKLVLEQAFDLMLTESDVQKSAREITKALGL